MDFADVTLPGAKAVHVNLADAASIDAAVDECGGQIDALFSCAGVADGTPGGTVTFSDGGTVLATVPLNSSDTATLATANLVLGSHSIIATYSGDADFLGGQSRPAHGFAARRQCNVVAIGDPPHRRITHIAERARHPRRVGIFFQRGTNSFFLFRCNRNVPGHCLFIDGRKFGTINV